MILKNILELSKNLRPRWIIAWLMLAQLLFAQSPQENRAVDAFWKALRAESYAEAERIGISLLQAGNERSVSLEVRQEIRRVYGRVLLAQGKVKAVQSYLAEMKRTPQDANTQQTLVVYQAWLDAANDKQEAAIKSLEKLLESQNAYESTADAAEVLARIRLFSGSKVEAKRAIDFAKNFLRYQGIESQYLGALLALRLEEEKTLGLDPSALLFRQARQWQQAKNFTEAGKLYQQILQRYPQSEWADPAGFRYGECLVGSKQLKDALGHWNQFVQQQSSGPWRGQATVGIVDLCLEEFFDLERARASLEAAELTLEGRLPAAATASWNEVAPEIYLRLGIVAWIDSKFEVALTAFEKVKSSAGTSAVFVDHISRLKQLVRAKQPLLPQDVTNQTSKSVLLLSLGTLYMQVERWETAQRLFERVLSTSTPLGANVTQRSYAGFGLAAIAHARGIFKEAHEGYLTSLKSFASGSWHDHTLYLLGLLIAEEALAQLEIPQKKTPPSPNQAVKPSSKELKAASQQRLTAYFQTSAQALPYWVQLTKSYPQSRHRDAALYYLGLLSLQADKSKQAVESWSELVTTFRDSPYCGQAYVSLADLALEWQLDLPAAEKHIQAALAWLAEVADAEQNEFAQYLDPQQKTRREMSYQIQLRAGLIAYLNGEFEQAIKYFQQAQAVAPPRSFVVISGDVPNGIERLIAAATAKQELAPDEVRTGDPQAKLVLQLVGLYYEAEEFERASTLCRHVLERLKQASREQRSWAYFMHGRCTHAQLSPLEAIEDFRAAFTESSQTSWGPRALFYVANGVFNYQRDVNEALRTWRLIDKNYPESEQAERANYYIAFALQSAGRLVEAEQAYQAFLKKYPSSVYVRAIQVHHLPKIAELKAVPAN